MFKDAEATGATARFVSGGRSTCFASATTGGDGGAADTRGAASSRPMGGVLAGESVIDMEGCFIGLPSRYRHGSQKFERKGCNAPSLLGRLPECHDFFSLSLENVKSDSFTKFRLRNRFAPGKVTAVEHSFD
jgi:hypothetical protein